ncbi:hypothetical protein HNP86_001800 [Methanococcus maripaludis]|uniref:Uncharacterized protein n=1 Tax=Methanococcus maripaludis TaxID=39152 RepID=A0A7J9NWE7_METMI|nr:hypothetical protein [Methanococcus maripaludis]MBA2851641.1 hypothetical protein [Methanococcus maripaludis]
MVETEFKINGKTMLVLDISVPNPRNPSVQVIGEVEGFTKTLSPGRTKVCKDVEPILNKLWILSGHNRPDCIIVDEYLTESLRDYLIQSLIEKTNYDVTDSVFKFTEQVQKELQIIVNY